MAKTILILAANPKDTSRLRLDQEVREIDNGLQRAQRRDEFILKQVWAVRRADFRRAMLDLKPNIVHFCGHGSREEGIAFEDEDGQTKLVSTDALAGFFELFADKVECVVLNACYSEVQAEAIAKHIPYVVGMKKAIGDAAAIEFAVAFYDALGAGESIEFAHKLACNAIQLASLPEYLTPALKKQFRTLSESEHAKGMQQTPDTLIIDVDIYFYPSGWMGDGEKGDKHIKFERTSEFIKITYLPGSKAWAGIYWQYPANNWGSRPGRNLVNVRKLIFKCRGARGGEVLEFKSGGIQHDKYGDTFEKSLGRTQLSSEWQQYEIDLADQDLSNVVGAFAWLAEKSANPKGLTFYLKEIHFHA